MVQKIALVAVLLMSGISTLFAQETHIVDLSGTGDFISIHAAVDAASSGDTIRVQPDQYAFTADLGPIEVDKKLVIIGSGYMPVEDGGSELIDIPGTGFFDLTSSADGTVIRGFRVQGASDFLDAESGTSGITIEENLFIEGVGIISLAGSADTVRSNIFSKTARASVSSAGANTQIHNNLFSESYDATHNTGIVYIGNGSGVKVFNNLFLHHRYQPGYNGGSIYVNGSPEIYSNGFVGGSSGLRTIYNPGSAFVTNNAFARGSEVVGLNAVEEVPGFVDFDIENETLSIEAIDEANYDLTLADGSGWIDTGRTGTPYLDTDGSRSDIGLYGGAFPFQNGKGAPTVPVVIQFQVSPTTVSPTGTITIQATGRIGAGDN